MEFRIADTFSDSLARLSGLEQKAVKTTAFDLQLNPTSPGFSFHKLDRAKDNNFWSIRVSSDIRLIVHKTQNSLLLCYVDHHDKAYEWAERRKLETHPQTGAAQLVEIRETIKEVIVPTYVESSTSEAAKRLLFAECTDQMLLSYGIPEEWLCDVRSATEDNILILADHLPKEAAEALLEIATGGTPKVIQTAPVPADPFKHPDAERRFRVMANHDELDRALEFPWEKWMVFLHPEQRQLVENEFNGPARVAGSAGTGKTIVALHRAVYLARTHRDVRILLTTFSRTLANALHGKLRRLIYNEPKLSERIDVHGINDIGKRLYRSHLGNLKLITKDEILKVLKKSSASIGDHKFSLPFLISEWNQIVDAWQIDTWEKYRDVERLGRKTRLREPQRKILWSIFELTLDELASSSSMTVAHMFSLLTAHIGKLNNRIFDYIVVDESQDIGVYHLKFLNALRGSRVDGLFFSGDLGQRIYQQPYSWKSLGVDVRGRSKTLRINYRTSHQIRSQADRLLGVELQDVDGNVEERRSTVSIFNGPSPQVSTFQSINDEVNAVAKWITDLISLAVLPHEIGIFVRSASELQRAKDAVQRAGHQFTILDDEMETEEGRVTVGTMHYAKGLEYRAVIVMACDDEVIPAHERIETVGDDKELEEIYNTERQLLYVACTRARDYLFVSSGGPASEFIDDLKIPQS